MTDINKIIKDARNVLVGKVPDPQSQIDQITLALIYKFMDAKDAEAVTLGVEPQFFVGESADYSFSKIMKATSNSKQYEMYTKGIDLLQKRTDLPETFTSVFKDAFIPYRDASTLHLFLEEIDKIPTDNTEILGTAFEDLLSIMGSQGDAGQFRTPRHIINMIVDIVEPKKGETILDPACGTAGFLISAYNKINEQDLTIEEREKLINEGLVGYDINPNMVKLSQVNLFLHGCKKPNIHLYDTLTEKDYWKNNYDVILANPPFMTPRGGIRPHELFSAINANRSEVLFTYYIAKHLKGNGRAGIIVPEGVVFQSANAYKNLRKMLVDENYLYAVISLPAGVFNPYSGVKTSVLLIDKALAKRMDKILFVKMNNDGFDLGAQRRPIEKNDIPNIIDIVKRFAFCVSTESENDFVDESGLSIVIDKTQIAQNDYVLVGDRYKKEPIRESQYRLYKLEQLLLKVNYRIKIPKSEFKTVGGIPIIDQSENFIAGYTDLENSVYHFDKAIICFGDHTRILKYIDFDFALGADGVKILLPNENVNTKYLYYLLLSTPVESHGYSRHYAYLKNKEIPVPPIEIQEQIVAELESYQKIIDGARQIVENYRPTIKVESSWKRVKLGDIFKLSSGKPLVEKDRIVGGYAVYGGNGITGKHNKYLVKESTIVIGRVGEYCGSVHVTIPESWVTDNALMVTYKLCDYNNDYVAYLLNQLNLRQYAKVGGQPSISQSTLYELYVPFPDIEVQNKIVDEIKEELSIVEQNKRLIQIFEQKIKDKINEVWGSETK